MENSFAYMRLYEKNFLQCKVYTVSYESSPINFFFIPAFTVHTCVTMNWKMMANGCQVEKQGFQPRDGKSMKILSSQKFKAKRIAPKK